MKKYLGIIFILSYATSFAQIGIGLRDSKFAHISYSFKNHYSIKIEHSIFSGKIETQYIRGIFSSNYLITDKIHFMGEVYYGTPYNITYYNCGGKLSANLLVTDRISIYATVNPHYDSYFHYITCYKIGSFYKLNSELDIFTCYSTIPEFRQKEKRLNGGLSFHVKNLKIWPYLSLPLETPIKSIRVLVNFNYMFKS